MSADYNSNPCEHFVRVATGENESLYGDTCHSKISSENAKKNFHMHNYLLYFLE